MKLGFLQEVGSKQYHCQGKSLAAHMVRNDEAGTLHVIHYEKQM